MNDPVPRTQAKMSNIEMAPGNVLIYVFENNVREETLRATPRDETLRNRQNLIKGQVICVARGSANSNNNNPNPNPKPNTNMDMLLQLQKGDVVGFLLGQMGQVLFHGRNSYPLDTKEGYRLFVVKVSDVALKTGEPSAIPPRRNSADDECIVG